VEQSSGRSWDFVGISREGWGLRDTSKQEKHLQTRKKPFEQGKRLSSKGNLPIKSKSLQVVGVSGQGKAVASDGG